jgi:3'-5' exoribonuclease
MNEALEPGGTPREWVGEHPFPWPPTLGLADGEDVVACFSVLGVTTGRTRNDAAFLKLQLADCYGTVEARVWDGIEPLLSVLRPGTYIGVRGRIERYQEERQLRIEQLAPVRVELDDLALFLPRSARPADLMDAELNSLIASVQEAALRQLLSQLLRGDGDVARAFRIAPAAKQHHHAYLGGLLEHTLSVTRVCELLAAHYDAGIDRDLLLTGALLHDIGKVREIGARSGFPYTDEGKLLGHILIGLQLIADAATRVGGLSAERLQLVQHLVASHQGRYEWQSPREPRTLEALILHYADDLDAKLNQAGALLSAVDRGWTAYDRSFGRDFLRHRPADERPAPPVARTVPVANAAAPGGGRVRAGTAPPGTLDLFDD